MIPQFFPFFAVRHGPSLPILVTSWTAWTAFLCTRFFALIFRASLHVRNFRGEDLPLTGMSGMEGVDVPFGTSAFHPTT
jgi:hypothetical protein